MTEKKNILLIETKGYKTTTYTTLTFPLEVKPVSQPLQVPTDLSTASGAAAGAGDGVSGDATGEGVGVVEVVAGVLVIEGVEAGTSSLAVPPLPHTVSCVPTAKTVNIE